jgi:hypothetical protein
MKHLLKLTASIWLLAGNFHAHAQSRAPDGLPPGFHHALLDVLGGFASFSGRASIQISNGPGKDFTSLSCSVAVLSGSMRLELDSFGLGLNLAPAEAAQLRSMHSVSILRPDKNRMYLVFPDFRSFVEIGYSKSSGTESAPPPRILKTVVGKEPVGDQPCDKSQWNITESDGEHYDITVWAATNLNNFPVQVRIGPPAAVVHFQDVHWEAPNSSLFEPPAGYTKYEGIQELIENDIRRSQNTNAPQ